MGTIAREELASKTHIMLIPFPAQGHMSPMIQLSKRLASKGVHVTLIAPKGISVKPQTSSINIEYISYDFEEDEKPNSSQSYLGYVKLKVLKSLPDLINKNKNKGYPVNVLVYDSLIPWGLELSHKLGLKGAPFFTQACAVCAVYCQIQQGSLKLPLEGLNISLPSMPLLEINDLPSSVHDGLYPGLLEILVNQFANLHKADWIFFNTFDNLENEVSFSYVDY